MRLPKDPGIAFEQYKESALKPYQAELDAAIERWRSCEERLEAVYETYCFDPSDENDKAWRKAFKELGAAIADKNRAKHELRTQERNVTVEYYLKHFAKGKKKK